MKFTSKGILAVVICTIFVYTACKKVGTAPSAPQTASAQRVAGVVASDLASEMAGTYGGISLSNGVKIPSPLATKTNSLILNSMSSLCGYTVDTTVSYVYKTDSTKSTVNGTFDFTYLCSDGSTYPNGYTASTSITSKGKTSSYTYTYKIAQDYTVKALDPQDTLVSLDGKLVSNGDFKPNANANIDTNYTKPQFQHQRYVLTNLKIDVPQNLDIISGTATFVTSGSNGFGSWSYSGTIEFIGNHMAIITINGQQYKANLITGTVTPV